MRITLKTNQSAAGSSNVMYVDGNSANAAYYVCWNGTNEVTSSTACASPNKPVYLITTLAVTPSGTRRMLQYEVTQRPAEPHSPRRTDAGRNGRRDVRP